MDKYLNICPFNPLLCVLTFIFVYLKSEVLNMKGKSL